VNLHVGRTFNALDGVAKYDSLPEMGKLINYFDPQILLLHKEYAKQLLTHTNPYTGKLLRNDPVMAWVELTNENSLYRGWHDNQIKTHADGGMLPYRHVRMLDSLWIAYLKSKYPSTDSLQSAWNIGSGIGQNTDKVRDGGFETLVSLNWKIENDGTGSASMANDSVNAYQGKYSGKLIVNQADGVDWHLQFKQVGLSITKDSVYRIAFAVRADSIRTISVSVTKETSPYTWYGGISLPLTPQWKTFSFSIKPPETIVDDVRLSFSVGSTKGIYWFDNVSFGGINTQGLLAGESFESNTIRRIDYTECSGFTDQRVKDMSVFYLQLEENYFSSMRSFLKDSLGVNVPIVGTNWNIGAADCAGMSSMDFMDNHAYWDHPSFPSIPWSSTDWLINNTSMVNSDGGTISGLMGGTPMLNKPYTISEYNNVFPNRYQTEGVLFLASYASFHDADGFMFFDYNGSSSDEWETDKIVSYFDLQRNTAMMSLIPSCALEYRSGMVKKYQQLVTLQYHPDTYLLLPKIDFSKWGGLSLYSQKLSLKYGVRTASYHAGSTTDFSSLPTDPVNPYTTDTKQLVWDTGGLFTVSAPGFNGATGFINLFPNHSFGAMTLVSANDFGTLTWISLDADSLPSARTSLMTVSSRIQNVNMVWDGIHTFHNNWGQMPTQLQPLTIQTNLHMYADSLVVRPLDPNGNPGSSTKTYYPSSPNMFAVTMDQKTDRTVWFGIDAYGNGVTSVAGTDQHLPKNYSLSQNYPNPFNPKTTIRYGLPNRSIVRLVITNTLGQQVALLENGEKEGGYHEVEWNANVSSGIYFYRIQATAIDDPNNHCVETKKMLLLR
jgi:hypothetical protein